jgi:hypothetical protein
MIYESDPERVPDTDFVPGELTLLVAGFSRAVAEAHFDGGATAAMWRQVVGLDRLLMTFLETPALNAAFQEAEAVLLGDPGNRAF